MHICPLLVDCLQCKTLICYSKDCTTGTDEVQYRSSMWQFYRHVILLVFKMSDGCLTPAAFTRCCVRMWRLGLLHLSVSIALCLPSHTSLSLSIYPFSHSLLSICLASFLVSVSLSHFLTVLLVCSVSLSLHQEFPYK